MSETDKELPHAGSGATVKAIHTIILDTAPILLNTPSISTLIANSQELVTTQAVISEVRGEEARTRLETLYRPFLTIRSAEPSSITFVREFARKTGDASVLSATDVELLALAYDLECERNGGDWRLRSSPGQKRMNGSPPQKVIPDDGSPAATAEIDPQDMTEPDIGSLSIAGLDSTTDDSTEREHANETGGAAVDSTIGLEDGSQYPEVVTTSRSDDQSTSHDSIQVLSEETVSEPSDSEEGWITPSNIKKHQALEGTDESSTRSTTQTMQVATMTGDFAMQNVLLQMNLNLISTKTCKRISHIKQMILRCHGCFNTTRDTSKQFCPRCGKPTLTRVTCTTNDRGEVKLHLKTNHQWNNRGNVFSIPKPVAGSANQKWKGPRQGGGQGGWGSDLILTEDQKEYVQAMSTQKRTKKKDLMDEDVLPSLVTGDRNHRSGGRIQVGGGRNVNSRKR